MSNQLHDLFEDLVESAPAYIRSDPHAAAVRGSRRRRRRRGAAAALVAVIVALTGTVLTRIPGEHRAAPITPPGVAAGQYPTRLNYPVFLTGSLPSRPGPIAGIVERVKHHDTYDQPLGWYAVSQTGQLWELTPGHGVTVPALSADGTHIGFLEQGGRYLTRNLVTGADVTYSQLGGQDGHQSDHDQYVVGFQEPSFWSPDDQTLAVIGAAQHGIMGIGALMLAGGRITPVTPAQHPNATIIGWIDASHLAWLSEQTSPRLVVTDLAGQVVRNVALATTLHAFEFSQWTGSISPDGTTLALAQLGGTDGQDGHMAQLFDTSDGTRVRSLDEGGDLYDTCSLVWQADQPAFPVLDDSETTALRAADQSPLVHTDPRLATRCSIWASTALAGHPHHDLGARLFGAHTNYISWHWRDWLRDLGALVIAALMVVGVVVGMRYRYRRYLPTRAPRKD